MTLMEQMTCLFLTIVYGYISTEFYVYIVICRTPSIFSFGQRACVGKADIQTKIYGILKYCAVYSKRYTTPRT
jgi:hypothetical protein